MIELSGYYTCDPAGTPPNAVRVSTIEKIFDENHRATSGKMAQRHKSRGKIISGYLPQKGKIQHNVRALHRTALPSVSLHEFVHLTQLLDVLNSIDVVLDSVSGSKLHDAVLERHTYYGAQLRLLGLSLALKAPGGKLAHVLVPFVVPGVAYSTRHAETHAEAVEHGEGRVDEKVHPRSLRDAHFTRTEQRLLFLKLPKQSIFETLRLTHEAHAHLHAVGARRALQRVHERPVAMEHRHRLAEQTIDVLPRSRSR